VYDVQPDFDIEQAEPDARPDPDAEAAAQGIDLKRLHEQITESLKLRRQITAMSMTRIKAFAGCNYREDWSDGENLFETHAYEWCAIMVPHLILTNPSVKVTDMGIADDNTQALQVALKNLMHQTRLSDELRHIAHDIQFDFGVAMCRLEPTPGLKVQSQIRPMRPVIRRVSPRLFFTDHEAPMLGSPRFAGHFFIADPKSMSAETITDTEGNSTPRYDAEILESCYDDGEYTTLSADMLQDGIVLPGEEKRIVGMEIWLAERNLLLTACWSCSGLKLLESPRQYIGPESGPYSMFGVTEVVDQVYPLAALAITQKQVDELNQHRRHASEGASKAKTLHVFNGAENGVIASFKSAADGDALSIPGFNGMYTPVPIRGASPDTMEYIDAMKERLAETSGLNDVMRGNITGQATATEITQAGGFADVRLKDAQNQFKASVRDLLGKVVDLMDAHEDVMFPVAIDDPNNPGTLVRGTYQGGPSNDPLLASWPWARSTSIEIEPYSMEYTNQAVLRQQLMAAQKYVVDVLGAAMNQPSLNAKKMIDDLMEQFNVPNGGTRYVDWAMFQQTRMMGMMAAGLGGGGGVPAPAASANEPTAGRVASNNIPAPSRVS